MADSSEDFAPYTFEAVAVFVLKEYRLYRVVARPDRFDFGYIGVPPEFRGPVGPYFGPVGAYFHWRAVRRRERLDREATEVAAQLDSLHPDDWPSLHRHNFTMPLSDMTDVRTTNSVFHAGRGTFWTFRTPTGTKRIFRLSGNFGAEKSLTILRSRFGSMVI